MYEIVEPICEFRALDIKSQQDVIESISVKASCQGKTMHATPIFSNIYRQNASRVRKENFHSQYFVTQDERAQLNSNPVISILTSVRYLVPAAAAFVKVLVALDFVAVGPEAPVVTFLAVEFPASLTLIVTPTLPHRSCENSIVSVYSVLSISYPCIHSSLISR